MALGEPIPKVRTATYDKLYGSLRAMVRINLFTLIFYISGSGRELKFCLPFISTTIHPSSNWARINTYLDQFSS